ncbi:P68 family surface lipoprotein [Mycoplasma sp. 48589B]
MNFKWKNLLLGGTGLVAVASAAGLTVACNNGTSGTQEKVTVEKLPEYMVDKKLGQITLINQTSTEYERANNSVKQPTSQVIKPGFEQNVRSQIVVAHTFSETGYQGKALATIAEVYNNEVKAMKAELEKYKKEHPEDKNSIGFKATNNISRYAKEISIRNIGSGYGAGSQKVKMDLESGNKSQFYDIVFNYAPVASNLASYNMLLSFNDKSFAELNTDLTDFATEYAIINAETQYIDRPSSWILPGFKSTNVLAINAPVLNYVVKTFMELGSTIADDDQEMKDFVAELAEKGKEDLEEVKTLWGAPVSNAKEIVAKYGNLKSSMFKNYDELIDFATTAQKLFANTKDGAQSDLHIFGVDSITSLYEQSLFAELDGNVSKMIQTVDTNATTKKVTVTYDILGQAGSEANVKSKAIYDKVSESVQAGGMKLFPGGQFASGDQSKHKFAFSIGSTAGYKHNFISDKQRTEYSWRYEGKKLVSEFMFEDGKNTNFKNIAKNSQYIMVMKKTQSPTLDVSQKMDFGEKGKNVKGLFTFGTYNNSIYTYNIKDLMSTDNQNFSPDSHSFMFLSKEVQDTFVNATANVDFTKSLILVLPLSDNEKYNTAFIGKLESVGAIVTKLVNVDGKQSLLALFQNTVTPGEEVNKQGKKVATAMLSDTFLQTMMDKVGYTMKVYKSTQFLSEDELISKETPGKWTAANTKNVIFSQGPSIIGIKSNQQDNRATKAFISWLIKSDKKQDKFNIGSKDSPIPGTPKEYIQNAMSYIMPYNGFEKQTNLSFMGTNAYLKVAFNLFKKAVDAETKSQYIVYEEPGSPTADQYRAAIEAAWDGLQKTVSNGESAQTFTSFVNNVQSNKPNN